jgi:hypothetical protein
MTAVSNFLAPQPPARPGSASPVKTVTSDEPTDVRGRSFAETLSDPSRQSEAAAVPKPDNENTVQPSRTIKDLQTLEDPRPAVIVATADADVVTIADADVVTIADADIVTIADADIVAIADADVVTIADADNLIMRDGNLSRPGTTDLTIKPTMIQGNGSTNAEPMIDIPTAQVTASPGGNRIDISTLADNSAVKLPLNQSLSLPASGSAQAQTQPQTLTITPAGENGETVRVAPLVTAAEPQTPPAATISTTALPATGQIAAETETLSPKAAAKAENADRPTLSTRAAETADYRALTQSAAGPTEQIKLADTPTQVSSALTNSDAPVPAKSSPVMTALPTLSPLTGMSDRLAATIMQTTQAQPTVTLDRLPQTVVAIALTARSATLQIDPPELGRIQLDYQFDSQGRTVVTLTPESDAARAALMDRMASIVAALEQGSDKPIDVRLGDARDFGSEFDQTSQDDRGSGSNTKDGAKPAASDHAPLHESQRFMRAPSGEAERLHILV